MDKQLWMEMMAKILELRNIITKEEYKNISKEIKKLG